MSDPKNDKRRRPLKTLPPDRFQPKVLMFWLGLVGLVLALYYLSPARQPGPAQLKVQEVVNYAEKGEIAKGTIRSDSGSGGPFWYVIEGELKEPKLIAGSDEDTRVEATNAVKTAKFYAKGRLTEKNYEALQAAEVFEEPPTSNAITSILTSLLPIVLIIGLLYWLFLRQIKQAGRGALSFGKSRAKMLTRDRDKVTFSDVAGCDEAKEEISEVVEFLKDPKKFQRMGGRIPKGVLLVGPPGTGKTLLAKAVAGEAEVPFFSVSGSDFVEMFVGVGASRVRDMFEQGRKNAPCIIFIDEIDAVGRQRGAGLGGGNDEREQTLNSLLVEMDGFDTTEGVIIMAATNRPDVLDNALLRPGRFDRQVYVDLPDILGREQILRVHARKIALADEVDLQVLARGTPGLSGAELANLLNESALIAARRNKKKVERVDIEDARDKIFFGRERRRVMDDEEKKMTAWHEAGHAVIQAVLDDGTVPVHKVTIIPRGQSLGSTTFIPSKDLLSRPRKRLLDQVCMAMGGRIAEELITHDFSNGAYGDIRQATKIARAMVCDYGMSDLGPIAYGENQDTVFLGRDITRSQHISEDTARRIDAAVSEIINTQYKRAELIIAERRESLDKIAQALLEFETIEGKHVMEILEHGEIRSPVMPTRQVIESKPAAEPAAPAKTGKSDPGFGPSAAPSPA